jgi:hypothetical protein
MAKEKSLANLSTEELSQKLNAVRKIHLTVVVLFVVIVIAWLATGYWRANVPVFASTIAMGLAASGAMIASRGGLVAELKRREDG